MVLSFGKSRALALGIRRKALNQTVRHVLKELYYMDKFYYGRPSSASRCLILYPCGSAVKVGSVSLHGTTLQVYIGPARLDSPQYCRLKAHPYP